MNYDEAGEKWVEAEILRVQAPLALVMNWTWEGRREGASGMAPGPLPAHWDGGAIQ